MNNTTTQIPDSIQLGADSLEKLPDLLRKYGHKVLLVHGHRPVEDGLLVQVRTLLNKSGFPHANMGQILPNPKYSSVVRGIKAARKSNCDIILALGGGSTLQCAKGIALGLGYKGDVWDFWTGKKKPQKIYPVASILTNPGSGAELSNSCTLVRKGKQKTVSLEGLACSFAILDPKLSQYPLYPTVNQIFTVFEHLFFSYLENPKTRKDAASLMQDIFKTGDQLAENIHDMDARTELYRIGLLAHTEIGKVHTSFEKLADSLSFSFSLPEGSAGSALFFAWCHQLDKDDKKAVIQMADDVFGVKADTFDDALKAFVKPLQTMQMPLSIPEAGLTVSDHDLYTIASNKPEKKVLAKANRTHLDD